MSVLLASRYRLAPMHEADLDEVMAAEERIYEFPWTRGNFVDSLRAGYSLWVARAGEGLAGYAALMVAVDDAHLLNLSVLPEERRRGLGGELLGHLFDVARDHGARRMILEVRPGNTAGIALYRRFLFDEIGRRRGYYAAHDGREDAIVMAREL